MKLRQVKDIFMIWVLTVVFFFFTHNLLVSFGMGLAGFTGFYMVNNKKGDDLS